MSSALVLEVLELTQLPLQSVANPSSFMEDDSASSSSSSIDSGTALANVVYGFMIYGFTTISSCEGNTGTASPPSDLSFSRKQLTLISDSPRPRWCWFFFSSLSSLAWQLSWKSLATPGMRVDMRTDIVQVERSSMPIHIHTRSPTQAFSRVDGLDQIVGSLDSRF